VLPGIVSPLLFVTAVFLILLVLVQRGKGGGLAGAFGGLGGQSAFGTKAGDLFTKITVGVAAFWILACIVSIKALSREESGFEGMDKGKTPEGAGVTPGQESEEPAE
jgi:preprotein translocase subunit SecG